MEQDDEGEQRAHGSESIIVAAERISALLELLGDDGASLAQSRCCARHHMAADSIVGYAKNTSVDVIVVGTHGGTPSYIAAI